MRKRRMFGIAHCLLLWTFIVSSSAQGTFEDADESNDYTSGQSSQQFDLRHTIPGEPDIDYPIYSEVPQTSFECTDRHEGYYADVESRCQAFRICAHTSRSIHGFGFLCPNGTLFSQQHFVCDWYRNVNCDESEQYYSKNDVNRIGSSHDMMETVRQMMEYPMKTISRALQRNGGDSVRNSNSTAARRPATTQSSHHHTLRKQLHDNTDSGSDAAVEVATPSRDSARRRGNGSSNASRKKPVTRAQVESVRSYNGRTAQEDAASATTSTTNTQTRRRQQQQQERQQQRKEQQQKQPTVEDKSKSAANDGIDIRFGGESKLTAVTPATVVLQAPPADEDVYVNSLGELSTDPAVSFDHDKAHIIAESPRSHHYGKRLNFAEKVNAGLNDLTELSGDEVLAPEYVKNIRKSTMEATQTGLASNINGLLDEIAGELDPHISGYQVPAPQKTKHAFKFLSRGFSSQSDRTKQPVYQYGKPKQTASTIRFSPNELPIGNTYKDPDGLKTQKHTNTNAANTSIFYENSDETIQFAFMTTTPKPIATEAAVEFDNEAATTTSSTTAAPTTKSTTDSHDNSYLPTGTAPSTHDDYSFLSPPLLEPPAIDSSTPGDTPTDVYEYNPYENVTAASNEYNTAITNSRVSSTDSPSLYVAYVGTTTWPSISNATETDTIGSTEMPIAGLEQVKEQQVEAPIAPLDANNVEEYTQEAQLDEDKLDVAQHAAKLLIAGVKLTTLDGNTGAQTDIREANTAAETPAQGQETKNRLLIQVIDDAPYNVESGTQYSTTPSSISTTAIPAAEHLASVASIAESGSFQERIRNYRRYASLQRATAKPLIYTKRAQPHSASKSAALNTVGSSGARVTTSTTAKPSSTTTTRSYLKRVAASRLRLSRLAAASNRATSTSTTASVDRNNNINIETSESSRKITVRNIDRELGSVSGKGYDTRANSYDSDRTRGAPTWESVRNNLKRFQVTSQKPSAQEYLSTAAPSRDAHKATRNSLLRSRNRYAYFKAQMGVSATTRNAEKLTATATSSTTTTTTTTTAAPPQLQQQQESAESSDTVVPPQAQLAAPTPSIISSDTLISTPNLDHILKSVSTSISYSSTSSSSKSNTPQTTATATALSPASNAYSGTSNDTPHTSSNIPTHTSTPANSFLSFDKLTRAIVDDSVLQNFRSSRPLTHSDAVYQTVPAATPHNAHIIGNAVGVSATRPAVVQSDLSGYSKLQAQATFQVKPQQRLPTVATSPAPRVVIARAEGQRIEPNSVSSIISALVTQQQPKATAATSYVPLDDFFTKRFGHATQSYPKATADTKTTTSTSTTTYYNNRQQYQQQQPQQQYQQSQQEQQPQQQQYYQQKAPAIASAYLSQQHYSNKAATAATFLPPNAQQQQHSLQRHQYPQQQFQPVSTTATSFLSQLQQQQEKLQQQQQLQQQQYKQQQLKQQQYFQQQQYARPTATFNQHQQQQSNQVSYNAQNTYQSQQQQNAQQQSYQQQQLQPHQRQPQQQRLQQNYYHTQTQQPYLSPLQEQQAAGTTIHHQQQSQQATRLSQASKQQSQQQPAYTQSIVASLQQQQQQLPQFPPLSTTTATNDAQPQPQPQPQPQSQALSLAAQTTAPTFIDASSTPPEHDEHLNVQLPALSAGLIPAPTDEALPHALALAQTPAQKRSDTTTPDYIQATATPTASNVYIGSAGNSGYTGASSYEVPLNSIGRLPNDITSQQRRLRKL